MSTQIDYTPISLRDAQNLVKDLTKPNPTIYWTDFLVSILTGHALFHLVLYADKWMDSAQWWFWPVRVTLFLATALLYYRSVMFTHELVHLPRGEFRGFRIAWNLLCGIPFLIPSYMYYPHVDHHRRTAD